MMLRTSIFVVLLGYALFTRTASAGPVVLWDNGPPIGSFNFNEAANYSGGVFVGDDFRLSAPSTVTNIQFHDDTNLTVTSLSYYFYTADGGLPGTMLASGGSVNLTTALDGLPFGDLVSFDLVSPLSLNTGTYFLVLGNGMPLVLGTSFPIYQSIDIAAAVSPGTFSSVISASGTNTPGQFTSRGYDLVFTILGNSGVATTPEPSTFILLGSLIGSAVLATRARALQLRQKRR